MERSEDGKGPKFQWGEVYGEQEGPGKAQPGSLLAHTMTKGQCVKFQRTDVPLYQSPMATITKYHRLGDPNNRNLFLIVLEARSPRGVGRCEQV